MSNPNMAGLVRNEVMKIASKKRLPVVILILIILVSMFTYAQYREIQEKIEKQGTLDWRVDLQQEIVDRQNRLASSGIQDEFRQFLEFDLKQKQYYLDNDINPNYPGAPTFIRIFFSQGLTLVLPLFIIIIMADIVSGEYNDGTIKTLLSRPVRRWKILMAKWLTVLLYTSLLMAATVIVCYAVSGLILGYDGWTAPILTGFQVSATGEFSTEFIHTLPMWEYLLMSVGLAWVVTAVVGTISLMISVLVKNTATGIGAMMAVLIAGTLLSSIGSSWTSSKYLVNLNFDLINYLEGQAPPIEGMTLPFSLIILAVWTAACLAVAFWNFTQKDMY
ncbi:MULTISPECIES: ABC transporter permease [Bacillaceae]|uniref:ABC transporter permease n=1 Tax=Bacillus infantis TaxID=324767 RepID=A0A5D4SPI5_9BACI|nr:MULTISPECIES: ABC transporter permease [Bacillus]MCP1161065.1 ABC transporter permease [Bacillus infantis]MDW2876069.1 ABC transporter permease [Bacillus infantis]PLR73193.1 ABC transporter permease [Bacillus sp. UMB0728]RYI28364.1 ABC transporter permease [Bacillus infantis]TYS64274.1 ABC transporter permease [Bacillus infantis]